jgi:hypothetical protein
MYTIEKTGKRFFMRKRVLLISLICLILCGCGRSTSEIEFFTLIDAIWSPVTAPTEKENPQTESAAPETTFPSEEAPVVCDYVLNTSSKKFHDPACSSVGKIKDSNRGQFTGNRDELLTRGYEPCKICNP